MPEVSVKVPPPPSNTYVFYHVQVQAIKMPLKQLIEFSARLDGDLESLREKHDAK